MPPPPRHELRHIVAGDLGDQLVRAEMRTLDQQRQIMLGVVGSGMVLSDLLPVTERNVVEAQRRARGLGLRN
jgi:hypothetical protein